MMPLLAVIAQAGAPQGLDKFFPALVSGIALGAIYALLAMGFVIIFKATQVVNFAHGAIAAAGAYLVVYFAVVLNWPGRYFEGAPALFQWSVSALVAVAVTGLLGLVLERLFIRPMIGEPLFSVAIITIGMDIAIRTVVDDFIGPGNRSLGDPWQAAVFEIGTIRIPHTQVATVVVAVVVMLAVAVFFKSRTGIAMRATAFDQEAAMAQGIKVGRIFALSWLIGALLAAIAGIFSSVFPRSPGVYNETAFVALRALPAVILGGLDSVVGAVVGGLIIGLAEVFAGTYLIGETWAFLGNGFSGVVPYIVMLLVLLIRPFGLFGTEEIQRV